MTNIVMRAFEIASDAHKYQVDKAGAPYILHPLAVASKVTTADEFVTALLHDVLEDSHYTANDLRIAEIPEHIISALQLLTRDPNVPYMDYIKSIKVNDLARIVKLADLEHNSDITRLPTITSADRERLLKYQEAIKYLK